MLLEKKITKFFDCIVIVDQCSVEGMTFSFHPVKCTMIDRCVINSAFLYLFENNNGHRVQFVLHKLLSGLFCVKCCPLGPCRNRDRS